MNKEVGFSKSFCFIGQDGKVVYKPAELPEKARFIDEGIRPIVVTLNQWEKVMTIASCEGHQRHELYTHPYVSFTCEQRGLVKMLKEKIRGTGWIIAVNDFTVTTDLNAKKVDNDYTLRPNLQGRPAASIEEIAELVKREGFDAKDLEQKLNTFICEYKY